MGVPRAAARFCGSQAFLFLQDIYIFFGTPAANSGRVSWTEVPVAAALRLAARPQLQCSVTQAHAGSRSPASSSMALWGPCLLLCLLSLLTQVAADTPTAKVKKAANAKKGKEVGGELAARSLTGPHPPFSPSLPFPSPQPSKVPTQ